MGRAKATFKKGRLRREKKAGLASDYQWMYGKAKIGDNKEPVNNGPMYSTKEADGSECNEVGEAKIKNLVCRYSVHDDWTRLVQRVGAVLWFEVSWGWEEKAGPMYTAH